MKVVLPVLVLMLLAREADSTSTSASASVSVLLLLAREAASASTAAAAALPLLLANEAGSCIPELAGLGAGLFQRRGQVFDHFYKTFRQCSLKERKQQQKRL